MMHIDRCITCITDNLFADDGQNVSICAASNGTLKLSFKGNYRAKQLQCVYIEDGGTVYINPISRVHRIIYEGVKQGFSIVELYRIIDDASQDGITVMCMILWINILAKEALSLQYVSSIFNDMKEIVKNESHNLLEQLDHLVSLLSCPRECQERTEWKEGKTLLNLIGECRGNEYICRTYRHCMHLCRIAVQQDNSDVCIVALAILESERSFRAPMCLLLLKDSALKVGDNVLAVPTGYNVRQGEPLVLIGRHIDDEVCISAKVEYIGTAISNTSLSSAITGCGSWPYSSVLLV
jgi:hypothetical protein